MSNARVREKRLVKMEREPFFFFFFFFFT